MGHRRRPGLRISFGGIDHVMARNRDATPLVPDTKVYSNTGGQSSKSTPASAAAMKGPGGIPMDYGYAYVAQAGMGCSRDEMARAVKCGYRHLYLCDPRRTAEGKTSFQPDSPGPDTEKLMRFLMGENRFASLKNGFPGKAGALYTKELQTVKARCAKYKKPAKN